MSRPITFNKSLGTRTVAPSRAVARPVYGSADDAEARARQLNELQRNIQQATDAATAATPSKYVEMYLPQDKAVAVIRHKLGRRARFTIVRWEPEVFGAACNVVAVAHDDEANTLIVRATYGGNAEIQVH